eukprot:107750-Pyramimonas_sp.AAC.3
MGGKVPCTICTTARPPSLAVSTEGRRIRSESNGQECTDHACWCVETCNTGVCVCVCSPGRRGREESPQQRRAGGCTSRIAHTRATTRPTCTCTAGSYTPRGPCSRAAHQHPFKLKQ